jgi:hypothetical protein
MGLFDEVGDTAMSNFGREGLKKAVETQISHVGGPSSEVVLPF